MTRETAFQYLRAVGAEYAAAKCAVEEAHRIARVNPTVPFADLMKVQPSDFRDCLGNLDATYILRLFAEFEALLRDYRTTATRITKSRRTMTEALLDAVAKKRYVDDRTLAAAHEVRELRNRIAHHRDFRTNPSLKLALSVLNKFVSFLPIRW